MNSPTFCLFWESANTCKTQLSWCVGHEFERNFASRCLIAVSHSPVTLALYVFLTLLCCLLTLHCPTGVSLCPSDLSSSNCKEGCVCVCVCVCVYVCVCVCTPLHSASKGRTISLPAKGGKGGGGWTRRRKRCELKEKEWGVEVGLGEGGTLI